MLYSRDKSYCNSSTISGDTPLSKVVFWSIRTVACPEPYVHLRIEPPSLSDPYASRSSPFPYHLNPANPLCFYPMEAYSTSPDFHTGYIQQFNLNVQRQFGKDWVVQVGYFGTLGRKLSTTHEINPARFGPGATAANAQQRRPIDPQYYADIPLVSSEANSDYNSLQISVKKQFARSYTMQLAYTYSKSIDNRSAISTDATVVQNPYDYLRGERGLSDFDQRHLLRINGVWDLPRLERRQWLRYAVGGWRLSTIASYNAGVPFSIVSGRDIALVGPSRARGPQRPDVIGNALLDTGRSRSQLITQYFNRAAFAFPAPGNFGTSGRNNMVGPGSLNIDAAVLKRFPVVPDRLTFELRGEVFNLPNYVNLGIPVNNMASVAFGRIVSSGEARVVQVAMRLEF